MLQKCCTAYVQGRNCGSTQGHLQSGDLNCFLSQKTAAFANHPALLPSLIVVLLKLTQHWKGHNLVHFLKFPQNNLSCPEQEVQESKLARKTSYLPWKFSQVQMSWLIIQYSRESILHMLKMIYPYSVKELGGFFLNEKKVKDHGASSHFIPKAVISAVRQQTGREMRLYLHCGW